MTAAMKDGLVRYVRFYETLTPESLKDIANYFTPEARFRDPFNDVRGIEKIRLVFEDMFKTIGQPDFQVTDSAWSAETEGHAYMRWTFKYKVRGKGLPLSVDGVSYVVFDIDGRVVSHVDYWDAAQGLYEHLPVIGWILRSIRKRVQVN
jgi:hypothetical protein